jgi:hypothetical protein
MPRRKSPDPKPLQQPNKMFVFVVLGIKPRVWGMADSTTELQPQPKASLLSEGSLHLLLSVFPLLLNLFFF